MKINPVPIRVEVILTKFSLGNKFKKIGTFFIGPRFLSIYLFESSIGLSRSCNCLVLPLIQGCPRKIHFTYPISTCEQHKSSLRLWWCFTRIHKEKWCSPGLPSFTLPFQFCHRALSSSKNSGADNWSDKNLPDLKGAKRILKILQCRSDEREELAVYFGLHSVARRPPILNVKCYCTIGLAQSRAFFLKKDDWVRSSYLGICTSLRGCISDKFCFRIYRGGSNR